MKTLNRTYRNSGRRELKMDIYTTDIGLVAAVILIICLIVLW